MIIPFDKNLNELNDFNLNNTEFPSSYQKPTGGILDRIESLAGAARHIDSLLQAERIKAAKSKNEAQNIQIAYERVLKETEARIKDLQANEINYRNKIKEFEDKEQLSHKKVNELCHELQNSRNELYKYQVAWEDIVSREKEAKKVLQSSNSRETLLAKIKEKYHMLYEQYELQKKQNTQLKRHCDTYQSELQSTLVRLHSAESKFNEISKELSLLNQSKKSHEEELQKIERQIKERFEWELLKEKEKHKTELEKYKVVITSELKEGIETQIRELYQQKINAMDTELILYKNKLQEELKNSSTLKEQLDIRSNELEKLGKLLRLEKESHEKLYIDLEKKALTESDSLNVKIDELKKQLNEQNLWIDHQNILNNELNLSKKTISELESKIFNLQNEKLISTKQIREEFLEKTLELESVIRKQDSEIKDLKLKLESKNISMAQYEEIIQFEKLQNVADINALRMQFQEVFSEYVKRSAKALLQIRKAMKSHSYKVNMETLENKISLFETERAQTLLELNVLQRASHEDTILHLNQLMLKNRFLEGTQLLIKNFKDYLPEEIIADIWKYQSRVQETLATLQQAKRKLDEKTLEATPPPLLSGQKNHTSQSMSL